MGVADGLEWSKLNLLEDPLHISFVKLNSHILLVSLQAQENIAIEQSLAF